MSEPALVRPDRSAGHYTTRLEQIVVARAQVPPIWCHRSWRCRSGNSLPTLIRTRSPYGAPYPVYAAAMLSLILQNRCCQCTAFCALTANRPQRASLGSQWCASCTRRISTSPLSMSMPSCSGMHSGTRPTSAEHQRALTDHDRVHRQQEQAGFRVGGVELAAEEIEHRGRRCLRPQRLKAVHVEVGCVVADPFDRQGKVPEWPILPSAALEQSGRQVALKRPVVTGS